MTTYQFSIPPPSGSFELLVDIDFQPYEPPDRGPEAQYPGCPESIAIEHVTLNGHDITSLLTEPQLDEIEASVWEAINDLRDCEDYADANDRFLEPL